MRKVDTRYWQDHVSKALERHFKECQCDDIISLYNSICTSLPHVSRVNIDPLTVGDIGDMDPVQLFKRVEASDFLCGRIKRKDGRPPFKATFPWIIRPENYRKILAVRYDNVLTSDKKDGRYAPTYDISELEDMLDAEWSASVEGGDNDG